MPFGAATTRQPFDVGALTSPPLALSQHLSHCKAFPRPQLRVSDQSSGQTHQRKNPNAFRSGAISGRRQTGRLVRRISPFREKRFCLHAPHLNRLGFQLRTTRQTAMSDERSIHDVSQRVKPCLTNNFHQRQNSIYTVDVVCVPSNFVRYCVLASC